MWPPPDRRGGHSLKNSRSTKPCHRSVRSSERSSNVRHYFHFGLNAARITQRRCGCVLEIGPQRIAPIAWLARHDPRSGQALLWLEQHLDHFAVSTRGMELLALTPYAHRRIRGEQEDRIVRRLGERPCSIDELVGTRRCGTLSFGGVVAA